MKNGVENANAGYFFGLIRVHYTLYFAAGLEDLLVSLHFLVFITLW